MIFDPARTSLADLRRWVIECGYHCAGQSVPSHICDPMVEPDPVATAPRPEPAAAAVPEPDAGPAARHEHAAAEPQTAQEAMGHGARASMSMAAMVADMRDRFLVALVFSIPILIWSPIGTDVLRVHAPVPFGLR